ncbi:MAG: hypothetical protein WDM91_23825 [Rhizomicrobium sp.]
MTAVSQLSAEHKQKLRDAKKELEEIRVKVSESQVQDLSRRIERVTSLIAAVQL